MKRMGRKRKKKTSRRRVSGPGAAAAADAGVARRPSDARDGNRGPGVNAAALGAGFRSAWTPVLTGLLIFLIATPAIVGPYGQRGGYTPDLHMAAYIQVGALVILSLFFLSCFARRQVAVPRSPILLPLLLFYGWAMLSVLWADAKYLALVDALDWTGAFLCALLIILILRDARTLRILLFFLLVSGVCMALLGIGQYLFGIDWVQQHIVPAATFSNKNMAGQYGVLTLPIAVAGLLYSRTAAKTWLFAVAISLMMTYIFYTRSRGALVGLATEAVILAGLLIYLRRKHDYHPLGDMPVRKIAIAASLALFVGMSYLTPATFGNVDKVKEASIGFVPEILDAEHGGEVLEEVADFTGSADARTTMWMNSIPMFRDNFLIGVGLGNWTVHYGAYRSWFRPDKDLRAGKYHANAHNDYVEILCELGIIGFVLFAWVIVALFRLMGRLLAHRDEKYFLMAVPIVLAIMGIAVNALFSFPLKLPVPVFLLLVYIAMLSNMYGAAVETGRDHVLPLPPMPVRALAAAVVILATVALLDLQRKWYQSEVYYRTSVYSLQQLKYKTAYDSARRARDLNPSRVDLLWPEMAALVRMDPIGSRDRVVEILEQMDTSRPYQKITLLRLAQAYSKTGQHEAAADTLRRLLKVQPYSPGTRYRLGIILLDAGKPEEALKEFEAARPFFTHERPQYKQWQKRLAKIDRLIGVAKSRMGEKTAPAEDAPADQP